MLSWSDESVLERAFITVIFLFMTSLTVSAAVCGVYVSFSIPVPDFAAIWFSLSALVGIPLTTLMGIWVSLF